MHAINSVGILGAGALGVMYAHSLALLLPPGQVWFIADPDRSARLGASPFTVQGESWSLPAHSPSTQPGPPDLLLVATKNYHLDAAMPLIKASAGPGTLVVSVLNGIESEARIEAAIPGLMVAWSTVQAMDALKEGSTVTWSRRGTVYLGHPTSRDPALLEAMDAAADLLGRAGIPTTVTAQILKQLWNKWMLNIGVNQLSALTGASFSHFSTDPVLRDLFSTVMGEVLALAQVEGVPLEPGDLEAWHGVIASLLPEGKTSMLQDVEAGRPTELDSFGGTLLRRAAAAGLECPVNRVIYELLAVRERTGGRIKAPRSGKRPIAEGGLPPPRPPEG